ncbi:MAG TPA: NAD(P)(+) transhydrogenase (Re/Si-specific) subunit beta, partial [Kofleriaceae bacterium]
MTLSYILMLVGYVIAGVLFILALRGLSTQETARRGNLYGMIGMAIAVGTMLSVTGENTHPLIALAIIGGGVVGTFMAMRVGMTQMPELVALLHSFV